MKLNRLITLALSFFALLLPVTGIASELSQECQADFNGRKVRFVVAKEAGGGIDQYTRLIANIFAETTGARTQISNIVGGGGFLGLQAVATAGDENLTVGLFDAESLNQPFGNHGGLDLEDFYTLGIVIVEIEVWVGLVDFDLTQHGTTRLIAAVSDPFLGVRRLGLAAHTMGIPLSAVGGYSGSSDAMAAILRGEVDVAAYALTSVLRAARGGMLKPVLLLSDGPVAEHADVPYLAGEGGIVDRFTQQWEPHKRIEAMRLARATAEISKSIRTLVISRNISQRSHRCIEEIIDIILFGDELAQAAAAINRPITPINAQESSEILQRSHATAMEYRSLLSALLTEIMQ